MLKLSGTVMVAGDTALRKALAICVIRSEREIAVEFDFEMRPSRWGRAAEPGWRLLLRR